MEAEILKKFGLSENEVRVYTALLHAGETTAYQLAKQTGLSQPSVHFLLDSLRNKGLVLKTPHAGKHVVQARDPREFLREKQKEVTELARTVPKLLAFTDIPKKPKVLFYEGEKRDNEALEYLYDHIGHSEMVSFLRNSPHGVSEASAKRNREFFTQLGERGVRLRGIIPKTDVQSEFMKPFVSKYQWKLKYVPIAKYAPTVATHIVGNVVLINLAHSSQLLLIENKEMADAERMKFEMVWKTLE